MNPNSIANDISKTHIAFIEFGSYPVRNGNKIRPLVDSAPTFRRICEAIAEAQHSVWLTITFMDPDFQMPGDRGTLFDVLDRAVERGLDVRIIFWRPNPESSGYGQAFLGSDADREMLAARGSRFRIRWDRTNSKYCQHQKAWLMDAGHESETSFVGGINPTFKAFEPGHIGEGHRHDVFVEVTGPSATDVHHNFVQRWNEASERLVVDGVWGHNGEDELLFPTRVSTLRGHTQMQIQRQVSPGRYSDSYPTPGGSPYDIATGERSVLEQYKQAIDAAQRTIYLENQALPVPEIIAKIEEALKRGVDIVLLVPDPESYVLAFHGMDVKKFFDQMETLCRYENFTLVGIAGPNGQGGRSNIYIHGKIMLIDDSWATIGSCNLHSNSLYGHTEMNASFWDPKEVRSIRCQLLDEHLGQDTRQLDDREALRLYRNIARKNQLRRENGDFDWQGLAYRMDSTNYGEIKREVT
ncbi:phosphatidylserine/phosphatidylglycerophosphate/cardiolipin synthase family protein [Paenibacillus glycanilyticus]|uniref:phospholipase D-like domain-containing protein n=1 Tax=Paenibacillus glycanilyticus TaxID=126569 RepID=UPI00203E3CCE|nr:phosphatidylserine/phosphatidylglycerophosphate/cardiolipin synthase family protein [Paenibacillus glycanilyticus]MCM3626240.1 phosphatidylserine/phosphatidylglycerophosphate/cardiolipin synthase family protein [Paenibacillus glycanilyticus]